MRVLLEIELRSPDGQVETLRVTERSSYQSLPTDTPPKVWYQPRGSRIANFEASLFGGGRTAGATRIGRAEVVLANADGVLDRYEAWTWQKARVLQGPTGRFVSLAAYQRVYAGQVERVEYVGREVVIRMAEPQARFDVPVPRPVYAGTNAGTGGIEGGAELEGAPKPLIMGGARGIEPVWVNTSLLIGQVSAEAVGSILMRERGAPISFAGDVGAAIEQPDLSIAEGTYVTDVARGLFRPGYTPQPPVTCDVSPAGPADAGALLRALGLRMGLAPAEIDEQALSALSAAAPAPLGLVVGQEATGINVADEIAASIGAWWMIGFDGLLRAALFALPTAPYALRLSAAERDVRIDRIAGGDDWGDAPVWRVEVRYDRHYSSLRAEDLASGLDDAVKTPQLREWPAPAIASAPSVLTQYPGAGVLAIDTGLRNQADAQALADRLLALHGAFRRRLAVTAPARLAAGLPLGASGWLQRPGIGLEAGLSMVVTGVSTDDGRVYRVRLWG
jgi:hypothetical protein